MGSLAAVFAAGIFAAGAISATGSFGALTHAFSASETTTTTDTTPTTTDTTTTDTTTDTTTTTTDTTPTTTDTTTTTSTTTTPSSSSCTPTGNEAISPDKASYAPGETAHITGAGFTPSCNVSLRIALPDNSTATGAGATDVDGDLTFDYGIPSGPVDGTFTVDVLGDGDAVLASATFDVASPAGGTACTATGTEAVSTDKSSYAAGETVHISGTGFDHGCNLVVRITLPDNSTASVDATTGVGGGFSADYKTPGAPANAGSFTVDVLGLADAVLASTTFETVAVVPGTATISSDKQDYVPGETVTLSGTGWQPDESVDIVVNDNAGQTWMRSVNVTAATDGTITDQFNLPDWFVANYTVTATGAVSGTAVTGFNDTINFGSASSAQNGSSGGNLTITKPASVANDDVLVAGITVNGGTNTTISPPGGWTLIRRTDNSTNVGIASYYHVVTNSGSEPASYTWTITSSSTPRASGGILRYSGVDTSNPIDVHNGGTGSSSSVTAPSVTTTAANDLVVGFFGIDDNATFTAPGSTTERFDVTNTDGSGPGTEAADYTQVSAGATGSKTATATASTSYAAQQVALRMASGGGGGGGCTGTFGSVASAANSSSGSSSISITKPSSVADGDVLVAGISVNGGSDTTISAPSGWTLILRTNNSTNMGIASYYHVVTSAGSEPANYSWGLSGDSTLRASGGIVRYSNIDTANPVDVSSGNTGSGTSVQANAVTTTGTNDLVIGFYGLDTNGNFTPAGGLTERYDVTNTSSSGPATEASDFTQASAGSTGNKTATASASSSWAAQLVALNVSCGGGGGGGGGGDCAIAFGSQTNADNGSSSTSLTLAKPSSTAANDFLIAQVTFNNGTDVSTITPPSGWTLIRRTNNSTHIGQALYYKVATGSEPSTYAFTLSSSVRAAGGIVRYTGVDTTTPFDPTAASGSIGTGNTGSSSTLTATGLTTTTANTKVVAFFGLDTNASLSTPSSMTERYEHQNSSGTTASVDDVDQAAAGATGNKSSTAGSSNDWVAQLVALRLATCAPSNTSPSDPTGLTQFKSDGTTAIAVGGFTNETTVVLKGTVSDPDAGNTVKLEVEVKAVGTAFNGAGLVSGSLVSSGSTASATVTGLSNGTSYHWRGRAVDDNGATSNWVSFPISSPNLETDADFTVDSTSPTVTIVSLAGSGGTDSSSPFATATNDGATITWNANENGSFSVRRGGTNCTNDAGTEVANGTYSTSPSNVATAIAAGDLNSGANTLRVCVTDAASNVGASEDVTVTKDTTAPTVTIDSLSNSTTDTTSPFAVFTNDGADIEWHADENGSFQVRRGGATCSSGIAVASGTYSTSPAHVTTSIAAGDLNSGANTLRVCVTDAATNTGASENVTVTKDTDDPTSDITFPTAGSYTTTAYNAGCSTITTPDSCGTADGTGSPVAKVEIRIQRGSDSEYWNGTIWVAAATWNNADSLTPTGNTADWVYGFAPSLDDTYTLKSRATDAAGNVESTDTVIFIIDNTAPDASGASVNDTDGVTTTDIDLQSSTSALHASWTGFTDANGVDHYEYRAVTTTCGTSVSGEIVKATTDVGNVQSYDATGLSLTEGTTYYQCVRAVDGVGNTSDWVASDGVTVAISTGTTLTVAPTSQQYSDKVTLTASLSPSAATGSVQFQKSTDGGGSYSNIGSPVAVASGEASLEHQVLNAAGTNVKFKALFTGTGIYSNSVSNEPSLTVTKEDAAFDYSNSNPPAAQVTTLGGGSYSGGLDLFIGVREKFPDNAGGTGGSAGLGDISNATLAAVLSPVAGGSNITLTCTVDGSVTGTGYSATKPFKCSTTNSIPLGTYEVQVSVPGTNTYYQGTYLDAFTVFDPSLGFATGGGWFRWAGNGDRVNFGFVMKYNKSGANLQGSFIAVRHHPDGTVSRMKSNSLGGLAITNGSNCGTAQFSGKSTYTTWDPTANGGAGDYVTTGNNSFTVWAQDCNNPGTGPDSIWIGGPGNLYMGGNAFSNKQTLAGGNIAVPHTVANGK